MVTPKFQWPGWISEGAGDAQIGQRTYMQTLLAVADLVSKVAP